MEAVHSKCRNCGVLNGLRAVLPGRARRVRGEGGVLGCAGGRRHHRGLPRPAPAGPFATLTFRPDQRLALIALIDGSQEWQGDRLWMMGHHACRCAGRHVRFGAGAELDPGHGGGERNTLVLQHSQPVASPSSCAVPLRRAVTHSRPTLRPTPQAALSVHRASKEMQRPAGDPSATTFTRQTRTALQHDRSNYLTG